MIKITQIKTSGTKKWAILKGDDEKELTRMSERLHLPVHGKGDQDPHLDVPINKIKTAIKYGAILFPFFFCRYYYYLVHMTSLTP